MQSSIWIFVLTGSGLVVGLVVGALLAVRWYRRRIDDSGQVEEADTLRRHLQRAQRMEALGILSGSIMHNLNNLLTGDWLQLADSNRFYALFFGYIKH